MSNLLQLPKQSFPGFRDLGRKPKGRLVVDWNNPNTRGLSHLILNGHNLQDLVRKRRPTVTSATIIRGADVHGRYTARSNSNTDPTSYPGSNVVSGSNPRTLIVLHKPNGAGGARALVEFGTGTTGEEWSLRVRTNGTYRVDVGGGTGTNLTLSTVNDQMNFVAMVLNGTTLGNTTVYHNGSTESASGSTTLNTLTNKFDLTDRTQDQIYMVAVFNRALSRAELDSLRSNPYQLVKAANSDFYFVPSAAGGTITGSAAVTATTATASSTGEITKTGSAAVQADTATASGTGTVGAIITGDGDVMADTATASATGEITKTGTAAVQADTATVSSTGEITKTGTAAVQADTATASGSGTVGAVITGTAAVTADTATVSGTGERVITATCTATCDTSTANSSGNLTKTGTCATQADTATTTGVAERIITGSAAAQAGTAFTFAIGFVGDVQPSPQVTSMLPLWDVY